MNPANWRRQKTQTQNNHYKILKLLFNIPGKVQFDTLRKDKNNNTYIKRIHTLSETKMQTNDTMNIPHDIPVGTDNEINYAINAPHD